MPEVQLIGATTAPDIEAVRDIFVEYAGTLPFDLAYQNFAAEISEFPGQYAPPEGYLLLVRVDGAAAGAVGVRPLSPEIGEIKRLYVRPGHRGLGLGSRLVHAVVAQGRSIGYRALRLDTIGGLMADAERLYRDIGFTEIESYYDGAIDGTVFYELSLNSC